MKNFMIKICSISLILYLIINCSNQKNIKNIDKNRCKIENVIRDSLTNYEFQKVEITPSEPIAISFYVKVNDVIDSSTIHTSKTYSKRFFYVIDLIEKDDKLIYLHTNGSPFVKNVNTVNNGLLNLTDYSMKCFYFDYFIQQDTLKLNTENTLFLKKFFNSKNKEIFKIEFIAKLE